MATWHISQTGSGLGNGTSADSKGSAVFFNTAGNWGAGKIFAGDTVLLYGTITTGLVVQASGTPGSPITISPDPVGGATLDQQFIAGSTCLNFRGKEWIHVDGVTGDAVNGNTTYPLRCINLRPSDALDSYFFQSNFGTIGAHIKLKHVEMTGNGGSILRQNAGNFIRVLNGGDIEIAYNWLHGVDASNQLNITGFEIGNNTGLTDYTSGAVIHHNLIQWVLHDGIRTSQNSSVYNNEIVGIQGSSHSDSILVSSASYVAIYNNYIHDSGDQNINIINLSAATQAHVRVYNNVIASDPGFGVIFAPQGGAQDDVVIVNNTFAKTSASSIRKANVANVTNVVIKNNIFGPWSNPAGYRAVDPFNGNDLGFLDANAWDYDTYNGTAATPVSNYTNVAKTLAQIQALGKEANGKMGLPTFVNAAIGNYHLDSGDTVAKGAGLNLTATYSYLITDKDGNARPASAPWDIGAYSSSDTLAPAAPTGITVQ